jgi:hypothetical protein
MLMDISKLGNHAIPVQPEIENTAVKPPSPGTPRESGASDGSEAPAAHESPLANVPKRPLDEPALKAVLSEKLGGGAGGYSGPQIRMDRNIIGDGDGEDGGGSPSGPEAPSGDGWGVGTDQEPKSLNSNQGNVPKSGDDNSGPTRGVGFNFTHPSRLDGDGHPQASGSGTGTSPSSSLSSSGSTSGTTGTSSSTVHPQKK